MSWRYLENEGMRFVIRRNFGAVGALLRKVADTVKGG